MAPIIGIIILAILAGFLYSNLKQPGIKIDCDKQEIIGFGYTNPPLAAIVPPPIVCEVKLTASAGGEICSGTMRFFSEIDVFECGNLKNYENQKIHIDVKFYDEEGNYLDETEKWLIYKK